MNINGSENSKKIEASNKNQPAPQQPVKNSIKPLDITVKTFNPNFIDLKKGHEILKKYNFKSVPSNNPSLTKIGNQLPKLFKLPKEM